MCLPVIGQSLKVYVVAPGQCNAIDGPIRIKPTAIY